MRNIGIYFYAIYFYAGLEGKVKSSFSYVSRIQHQVRGCIEQKNWKEAGLLLSSLNSTILSDGRNVVYVIAETCRRTNSLAAVIPLLEALKLNENICTEDDIMPLLSECTQNGNMRPAQKIITYLESRHVKIDIKAYSKLVKGYGIQKNEQMVDYTVSRILKSDMVPDTVLLNSIMDAYIRCGCTPKAIQIFDSNASGTTSLASVLSFPVSNLQPDTNTYNILLKGLRGNFQGDLDSCWRVVDGMQRAGVRPDAVTTNTLVDACVRAGNLTAAEELLRHPISTAGVEAYSSLMAGYASRGQVDACARLLALMRSRGVLPNDYTLTALMGAFLSAGDITRAKALLNESATPALRAMDKSQVAALHNAFLSGLSAQGGRDDMQAAEEALRRMQQLGIPARTAVLNGYLHGLCACPSPRVQTALECVRRMCSEGPPPDSFTYSILFTVLGKEGLVQDAVQLYVAASNHMDAVAINSLLRAFVSGPVPFRAIELYQKLVSRNYNKGEVEDFVPNKATFTILFLAIARAAAPTLSTLSSSSSPSNVAVSVAGDNARLSPSSGAPETFQDAGVGLVLDPASFRLYESVFPAPPVATTVPPTMTLATQHSSGVVLDVLLRRLYKDMRFEYNIEVDNRTVAALNRLFMVTHACTDYSQRQSTWRRAQKSVRSAGPSFSSDTARLIFDDLCLLGYAPRQIPAILFTCDYSDFKTERLMQQEPAAVAKGTSASYRIFNKYGWNKMDSRWSPIF